jgi:hypothetical protein
MNNKSILLLTDPSPRHSGHRHRGSPEEPLPVQPAHPKLLLDRQQPDSEHTGDPTQQRIDSERSVIKNITALW